jgi:hypothetical protein
MSGIHDAADYIYAIYERDREERMRALEAALRDCLDALRIELSDPVHSEVTGRYHERHDPNKSWGEILQRAYDRGTALLKKET